MWILINESLKTILVKQNLPNIVRAEVQKLDNNKYYNFFSIFQTIPHISYSKIVSLRKNFINIDGIIIIGTRKINEVNKDGIMFIIKYILDNLDNCMEVLKKIVYWKIIWL